MKEISLLQAIQNSHPELDKKEAYARIMCGEVRVNGERIRRPEQKIRPDVKIEFEPKKFVSRGGKKLEAALQRWKVPVAGKVFLDAGASTGGFSDCLLQYGAKMVHSVDVGYNQLDYKLRRDPRVQAHERCNIMSLTELSPEPEAAVADLSFRSIHGAAGHILEMVREGWMIALVKPQFEIIPAEEDVEKKFSGVIHDAEVQVRVLLKVAERLESEEVEVLDIMPSPILGRKGNREFLFLLSSKIKDTINRFHIKRSASISEMISEAVALSAED